jgi:hypothetical protein
MDDSILAYPPHSTSIKGVGNKRQRQNFRGRYPADFLANLPEGVTYNDPEGSSKARSIRSSNRYEDNQDYNDGDIVKVADFTINIEKVTKQQLISMRKFLPAEEYRLLKNRKSARLCRRKRKEERGDMQQRIDLLIKEN